MDRTMSGPGLVGAGLKGMLKLGSQPVRKGIKAVTSFASKKDEIQDFVKKERNKQKIELNKVKY